MQRESGEAMNFQPPDSPEDTGDYVACDWCGDKTVNDVAHLHDVCGELVCSKCAGYAIKRTRSYLPPPPTAASYRPAHGGYPWLVPLREVLPGLVQVLPEKHFPRTGWRMRNCPAGR